jgi:hypothetical protein
MVYSGNDISKEALAAAWAKNECRALRQIGGEPAPPRIPGMKGIE